MKKKKGKSLQENTVFLSGSPLAKKNSDAVNGILAVFFYLLYIVFLSSVKCPYLVFLLPVPCILTM